jgi:hypothetical protein
MTRASFAEASVVSLRSDSILKRCVLSRHYVQFMVLKIVHLSPFFLSVASKCSPTRDQSAGKQV